MCKQKYSLGSLMTTILLAIFLVNCDSSSDKGDSAIGLTLPDQVEIIPYKGKNAGNNNVNVTLNNNGLGVIPQLEEDGDDNFDTAGTKVFINNSFLQAANEQFSSTLCVMVSTGALLLPNQKYKALVDYNKCHRSTGTHVSKPSFVDTTVVSDRNNITTYLAIPGDLDRYIISEMNIKKSNSADNIYGEFDVKASMIVPNNTENNGYYYVDLAANKDNMINMKFISTQNIPAFNKSWMSGVIDPKGAKGSFTMGFVGMPPQGGDKFNQIVQVSFNDEYVLTNSKIGTQEEKKECFSLDPEKMKTSYIYNYNLYNSGDKSIVKLVSTFLFNYVALDGTEKQGFLNKHDNEIDFLFEDGNSTNPTKITDAQDSTKTYTVSWTDGKPTLVDPENSINLDNSLDFAPQHDVIIDGNPGDYSPSMVYDGVGKLYQALSTGQEEVMIKDGAIIADKQGKEYLVKQTVLSKEMGTEDVSTCEASLTINNSYTEPVLVKTEKTLRDMPDINGAPKFIDGVIQQ